MLRRGCLRARKPPARRSREMQRTEITNESALKHERQLVAERHADRAQKRADGEGGPLRGLRQRVRGVQFVLVAIDGQNGRAPAGEERRGEHQQRAQQVEQPVVCPVDAEDEAERDDGAHQVARDHDALAIEAVEQDAGDGSAASMAMARESMTP